jgi:hypothetical protein
MSVAVKKAEFLKAIRDNIKTKAKAKGVRLSKEALDDIVIQQATDAICGDSKRVLDDRLDDLLDMA